MSTRTIFGEKKTFQTQSWTALPEKRRLHNVDTSETKAPRVGFLVKYQWLDMEWNVSDRNEVPLLKSTQFLRNLFLTWNKHTKIILNCI